MQQGTNSLPFTQDDLGESLVFDILLPKNGVKTLQIFSSEVFGVCSKLILSVLLLK